MEDAWRTMPFAPEPGTDVCALEDLSSGALGVDLDGFPVLVVQSAAGLRAYVKACPHQYLPLDWRSSEILSRNGTLLRCSNHSAGFDASTGVGLDGLGVGCALDPVPVIEREGRVVIAGD